MLSLLQLLNSLLHCHMFNQEGEINPVKIKCSYAGKETTQMMHAKTIITSFMKWPSDGVSGSCGPQKTHWLLLARLPSQPPAPVTPFLTCLLSPFHGQGQPSNGHLGMVISQLYSSHAVSSPKTLPWELLSEVMNDKWQEIWLLLFFCPLILV